MKKIYYPKTKETKAIDNQPIVTFLVNKKGEFIEVIDVQNADSIIDVSQIPAEMREQVIKTAKDTVMNFIKTKRQEEWMLLLQQWYA